MASEALVLEDIDAFYGDSHVLHHVSLQLGQGRLLGLLGRNGAGKSTSMSVTVGLLPPRGGTVKVFGHPLTGRAPETIAAHGVALVPQGRRVFRSLTVRENLVVAARRPRRTAPALWTLETVGELFPVLRERGDQLAASLSGGEQQMLAIARALMSNPRVLLMDEATVGLDPASRSDLLKLLLAMRRERAVAVLWATHLCDEVADADRVIVMHKGKVLTDTTPAALLTATGTTTVEQAFLSMTETEPERV